MADTMEWTGRTVEAALEAAAADLGCAPASLEYTVLEQPSRGFLGLIGRKDARIRVRDIDGAAVAETKAADPSADMAELETRLEEEVEETQVDAPAKAASAKAAKAKDAVSLLEQEQRARKFLEDVFAAMKIEVELQRSETEEGILFQIEGESLGILIGKHGQTLDALQYLTNLAANRGVAGERLHVQLDIEGYRARREETLTRLAGHLAEKACRIGQEIHLEPMNRHERKIIHMALQDSRKVSTYSAGDEPRRYVVIVPRRRRRAESNRRSRENEDN
ncbi:RNA-binding cell elongation regulator Jag/EloR [Mitsuokella multacida]|uniref:RNA-binding cell elongation regulator Jag/EloR n=2 Tax=Mitsuokella multacida TaxID=52226 RepID=UPI001F3427EC|nr:RNA-binding cell elongation regulator Jag/EloR [Mitsuokella multacida]MCF2584291.1 Jag N-terminal domain-containing protein [Mitsuokella multacida]